MTVYDADKHAALLAGYCLDVQAGQQVVVHGGVAAAPLLAALQREILARDAWPLLRVGLDEGVVLDGFAPLERIEAETTDATIRVISPTNTNALADTDPALLARAARARAPLREAGAHRRWTVTLYPTPALAQNAKMGTVPFFALVGRALFLDRPDPVAAWGELRDRQARLIETLSAAEEIRIEAPGTDLTLNVAGRSWQNSDGKRNLPSGEVFTGPHETSATGTVRFTIPSSPSGVDVAGVELTFADGEVVHAHAERGDAYLQETLATDAGARRLGELGVGTNFGLDRPTGLILLDEKIGGTVHLALGRSYPETGGVNESAVHWDLICDLRTGGRLLADGEPVVSTGPNV
jgi:aminopeptidase